MPTMYTIAGQIKKSWKFLVILAFLGGLYGAHPYVVARVVAGDAWQGVVPAFSFDGLAYMTRANAAIHGEFGNPYYATIYNSPSPSFTLVDSILGIPYAFFSPFVAAVWNTFMWNALLALMLGTLLLWLGYSRSAIVVSWLVLASSIFWFMLRTGHTEIMYPYFILFFTLLLRTWYKDRLQNLEKHDYVILGLCAGFAAYLYTFLFQVIVASLAVGVLLSFLLRRTQLTLSLIRSGLVVVALALPYLAYFKGVSSFPAFAETINDFGGMHSYFPSPQLYFYGRWLAIIFTWSFLLWLVYRGSQSKEMQSSMNVVEHPSVADVTLTIITVSLGTLGVMGSNVITGVDIAVPSHANFFAYIIIPLGLILLFRPTIWVLKEKGSLVMKIFLLICALIVVGKVAVTIPEQLPNPHIYRVNSVDTELDQPARVNFQYIMPALTALRSLSDPQVIVAPKLISSFIPLYTGQRVLFDSYGRMYIVGTIASVERLLMAQLGRPLSPESMLRVLRDEAFANTELDWSDIVARNNFARELCAAVLRSLSCETLVAARIYTNDGLIDPSVWFDYYQTAVRPHVVKYLHRFNVSQVVIDRRLPIPEFLHTQTPWYSDEYYAIYDIADLSYVTD